MTKSPQGNDGEQVNLVFRGVQNCSNFDIVATKAGRRVEVSSSRGTVEVSEVTRTGNVVRSGRFMQTRVVAIVEHPSTEDDEAKPRARKRRRVSDDQSQML